VTLGVPPQPTLPLGSNRQDAVDVEVAVSRSMLVALSSRSGPNQYELVANNEQRLIMDNETPVTVDDIESTYKVLEYMRENNDLFDDYTQERINDVHTQVQDYELHLKEIGVIEEVVR